MNPPVEVESATWSAAGQLDYWVKERYGCCGRVRQPDGEYVWLKAGDDIAAPGSVLDALTFTSADSADQKRVLLAGQTTGSQNGLYSWTDATSSGGRCR